MHNTPNEKLREICERQKEKGKIKFLDSATNEQVESFEKETYILFPPNIKNGYSATMAENSACLQDYNCMMFFINPL